MSASSPSRARIVPFPGASRPIPRRGAEARAFLPAALEIMETPASPAGRATALTIAAAAALAIGWACVGQVDIIATAPGQVVPVGRSKTVQPLEAAVVRTIDVADGDHVRAGQALVTLDPTPAEADRARFAHDRLQARLDAARLGGLRQALRDNLAPVLVAPPSDASAVQLEATQAAMRAQAAEQAAKLAGLAQQIAEKQAEGSEAAATLAKLQASLPWVEQQAQIRREAKDIQFGNRLAWLEAEQRLVEQQHDLAVAGTRQAEANAARGALERQQAQAAAEYEKTVLGDLAKAEQQGSQAGEDLHKAEQRLALQTLRAPIDGTVQQLAIHTVGGVVSPAQALLVVVPDDPGLLVEAQVDNADVGFVHAGQDAEVKVETFTFTRYGLLHGHVVDVSRDSVTGGATPPRSQPGQGDDADKPDGAAKAKMPGYTAHIALDRSVLFVDGREETLAPGMAVTAEIKTGRRSVISYLLSPLARYTQESGRER